MLFLLEFSIEMMMFLRIWLMFEVSSELLI